MYEHLYTLPAPKQPGHIVMIYDRYAVMWRNHRFFRFDRLTPQRRKALLQALLRAPHMDEIPWGLPATVRCFEEYIHVRPRLN